MGSIWTPAPYPPLFTHVYGLCPQCVWLTRAYLQVEAHPIPETTRPRRVQGRIALVDAAGYGEGIYFAAKSGRMAAESTSKFMQGGTRLPSQTEIELTYIDDYDRAYGPTYAVLDIPQKVFYSSNGARGVRGPVPQQVRAAGHLRLAPVQEGAGQQPARRPQVVGRHHSESHQGLQDGQAGR